jgi:hypothetical protein
MGALRKITIRSVEARPSPSLSLEGRGRESDRPSEIAHWSGLCAKDMLHRRLAGPGAGRRRPGVLHRSTLVTDAVCAARPRGARVSNEPPRRRASEVPKAAAGGGGTQLTGPTVACPT